MSLINDALKKSGNKITVGGPKRPPAEPGAPGEPPKPGGGGKGFTVFLICLVLAGGAALGAWNYWNKKYKGGYSGDPKSTNAAGKAAPNTNNNPIARAAAVFNKVLDRNKEGEAAAGSMQKSVTPEPAAGDVTAAAGTGTGTTTAKKSPIVVKAKPKPAWIPGLPRVQAIIYRENDPTALIDGRTVRPGERIGEVVIIAIKKDAVTMRWKDEMHEVSVR